jgi:tetratricopeptide (TPR) repeat protein
MRRTVYACAALASFLLLARADAQGSQDAALCARANDASPDEVIRACTAVMSAERTAAGLLLQAYFNRADAYRRKNENALAIEDYSHVIRHDRLYPRVFLGRAVAYLASGEYERAIVDFDQSLRSDRPGVEALLALYGRGVARQMKGDAAGGQADIAAAQRQEPRIAEMFRTY